MSDREYEALRSALASTRMEGFCVTEQTEKDCIRLMNGEVSVADLVKDILTRPQRRCDVDPNLLMIATIQSAQGVMDLLKQVFAESILL